MDVRPDAEDMVKSGVDDSRKTPVAVVNPAVSNEQKSTPPMPVFRSKRSTGKMSDSHELIGGPVITGSDDVFAGNDSMALPLPPRRKLTSQNAVKEDDASVSSASSLDFDQPSSAVGLKGQHFDSLGSKSVTSMSREAEVPMDKSVSPSLTDRALSEKQMEDAVSAMSLELVDTFNKVTGSHASLLNSSDNEIKRPSIGNRRKAPVATMSEFNDDYEPADDTSLATLDPDLFAPQWTSEQNISADNFPLRIPPADRSLSDFESTFDYEDTDGGLSEASDGGEFIDENFEFRRPALDENAIPSLPAKPMQQLSVTSKKGYLLKYSSQKSKLGSTWQKRWVTFDHEFLKYFSSNKSAISKRVIPVCTMDNVELDIKTGEAHPFRFLLKTVDRVYCFAAESMDELTLWSSVLMLAIMTVKAESFQLCGEMNSPDQAGFVKIEGKRNKLYSVVKRGQLCFYNTVSDFRAYSPIHQVDLQVASVKDLGKCRLQLQLPHVSFVFLFETPEEHTLWKNALQNGISHALGDNKILELVYENRSNRHCADCRAPGPEWAAINIGITLCQKCAGIHREMPSTKVRSLRMDCKVWKPALIQLMKAIGNDNANSFFEQTMTDADRIDSTADMEARKKFISNKYKDRVFCRWHLHTDQTALNNGLLQAVIGNDLLKAMNMVHYGADVSYGINVHEEHMPSLPVDRSLLMEFLHQNSGERSNSLSSTASSPGVVLSPKTSTWECYKHNREVNHCGYLYESTSSNKGPSKRWYILEKGVFSCLKSDQSGEVKDAIDQRSMVGVGISYSADDRMKHSFDLVISVNECLRCLHLAAESNEDRKTWIVKLARSMAPVPIGAVQQASVLQRGGFVYVRLSPTHDWMRYWIHLSHKTLFIYIKDADKWEEIDMRKAKSLDVLPAKDQPLAVDNSDAIKLEFVYRSEVFILTAMSQETSMWCDSFKIAMAESTNRLSGQALNADNVPVFVQKCVEYITQHGIELEGIYRKAGHNVSTARLLKLLQNDGARIATDHLDEFQIHDVATALKRFLRTLDDPVMTKSFYDQWIALTMENNTDRKLIDFRRLLAQLPLVNFSTLKYIVKHLVNVSEFGEINRMHAGNLSTIFGQVLFTSETEKLSVTDLAAINSELAMQRTSSENAIVLFMLENYSELFELQGKYEEGERMLNRQMTMAVDDRAEAADDHVMFQFFMYSRDGKEIKLKVLPTTKASETLAEITEQEKLDKVAVVWAIFEVICGDELERPIHYSETLVDVKMRWARWPEEFRRNNYLCVKPAEIYRHIDAVFDPFGPLYGELKMASKKKSFKKYYFKFNQKTLCYSKDPKAEAKSGMWNVADITIYIGIQAKRSAPTKYGATFILTSEPPVSPFFGRSLSFANEQEMYQWLAAFMLAQHPEGLTLQMS